MKRILLLMCTLPLMFCSCEDTDDEVVSGGKTKMDYSAIAKEVFDIIEKNYRITDGTHKGLMQENAPKKSNDPACSFIWPYDWYMSAVTLMDDLGYDVNYVYGVENYQRYWQPDGNGIHYFTGVEYKTPGYSSGTAGEVNSGNKTGDRYYDDNAWVAINLVDAYEKTKDEKYLQQAKATIDFIYTGLDDELGGGVWWNEARRDPTNGKKYKPICTNGPFTVALLKYYKACPDGMKDESILGTATSVYNWMTDVLQDKDYLYWGDIQDNGTINKAKDPAITGMVMQCGVLLYELTGDRMYLDNAILSADASFNHFVVYGDGVLLFPGEFTGSNIKLFRAYLALAPYYSRAKQYINAYPSYVTWVYKNKRTAEGFFYQNIQGDANNPGNISYLINQSVYLEAFASIALYQRDGKIRN